MTVSQSGCWWPRLATLRTRLRALSRGPPLSLVGQAVGRRGRQWRRRFALQPDVIHRTSNGPRWKGWARPPRSWRRTPAERDGDQLVRQHRQVEMSFQRPWPRAPSRLIPSDGGPDEMRRLGRARSRVGAAMAEVPVVRPAYAQPRRSVRDPPGDNIRRGGLARPRAPAGVAQGRLAGTRTFPSPLLDRAAHRQRLHHGPGQLVRQESAISGGKASPRTANCPLPAASTDARRGGPRKSTARPLRTRVPPGCNALGHRLSRRFARVFG